MMKRLVQGLAVLLVMTFSVSLAQADRFFVEGLSNAQISFGNGTNFSILAAAGIKNIAGPLGIRGGIGLNFVSGGSATFRLSADALVSFGNPRDARDAEFYAGGGLRLIAGGSSVFGLGGVVGAEFPLNTRVSIAAEFQPTLYFTNPAVFEGAIIAGFRLYI
jgi:hypothetical protein